MEKEIINTNSFKLKSISHRKELLSMAISSIFILSLLIIFSLILMNTGINIDYEPLIIGIILIVMLIILLFIFGLTTNDAIVSHKSIQLPKSDITSILSLPRIRNYNDIIKIDVLKFNNYFDYNSIIKIKFKDGYSGIITYWDLVRLKFTDSQIILYQRFLDQLQKKIESGQNLKNEIFYLPLNNKNYSKRMFNK